MVHPYFWAVGFSFNYQVILKDKTLTAVQSHGMKAHQGN